MGEPAPDFYARLSGMTPGEVKYFETGGQDAALFLRENGLSVTSSGALGCVTLDGRVVDRAKYVNGFCLGDIVWLRSGSVAMLVDGARTAGLFRHVACKWMLDGKMLGDSFEPECLTREAPPAAAAPAAQTPPAKGRIVIIAAVAAVGGILGGSAMAWAIQALKGWPF